MTPTNVATGDLAASENDPAGDSSTPLTPKKSPRINNEIILRIVAAAIMAPLGLWAVFTGGLGLKIATALCAVLAAFEWNRMASKLTSSDLTRFIVPVCIGLCAVFAVFTADMNLAWAGLSGLVAAVCALTISVFTKDRHASMAFGALYVTLPFGAFIFLREVVNGPWLLISLMLLVWATDIAAFLAGRGFGGPQLSPRNSPNKTWTGALGALICTVLAGVTIARIIQADIAMWVFVSALVSILAQAGDLLESAFKRRFGVKDTSGIIPGHGGVLDRLDSLMAVSSVVGLAIYLFPGMLDLLQGRF